MSNDLMQQRLDAMQAELLPDSSNVVDAVEFANALLNRAAGIVFSLSVTGIGDRMVADWLHQWASAAETKASRGGRIVRH